MHLQALGLDLLERRRPVEQQIVLCVVASFEDAMLHRPLNQVIHIHAFEVQLRPVLKRHLPLVLIARASAIFHLAVLAEKQQRDAEPERDVEPERQLSVNEGHERIPNRRKRRFGQLAVETPVGVPIRLVNPACRKRWKFCQPMSVYMNGDQVTVNGCIP